MRRPGTVRSDVRRARCAGGNSGLTENRAAPQPDRPARRSVAAAAPLPSEWVRAFTLVHAHARAHARADTLTRVRAGTRRCATESRLVPGSGFLSLAPSRRLSVSPCRRLPACQPASLPVALAGERQSDRVKRKRRGEGGKPCRLVCRRAEPSGGGVQWCGWPRVGAPGRNGK